jgi:hypothetical protein
LEEAACAPAIKADRNPAHSSAGHGWRS